MSDAKDLFDRKEKKVSFFKKQDWFLSAVLVIVLYVIMLIYIYGFKQEESFIEHVIHVLPAISVFLVIFGFVDKRKKEAADAALKRKRYETRMALLKYQREIAEKEAKGK